MRKSITGFFSNFELRRENPYNYTFDREHIVSGHTRTEINFNFVLDDLNVNTHEFLSIIRNGRKIRLIVDDENEEIISEREAMKILQSERPVDRRRHRRVKSPKKTDRITKAQARKTAKKVRNKRKKKENKKDPKIKRKLIL